MKKCCGNIFEEPCVGCKYPTTADCITYKGDNLSCINVNKGDNLEEALEAINAVVCNTSPVDIPTTSVTGVTNETVVTSSVVGDNTNYQVGLSPTITNIINSLEDSISDINAELLTKVCNITTNTPDYLVISNPTGCTYNIDFTPSGFPTSQSGIIYNESEDVAGTGIGSSQVLKSFTNNYVTSSAITKGDVIKAVATVTLDNCSITNPDKISLRVRDGSGILAEFYYPVQSDTSNVLEFTSRINVLSTSLGIINIQLCGSFASMGTITSNGFPILPLVISKKVNTDFTNLTIDVIVDYDCGGTQTFAREFYVEVLKKI